jgi:hypothetical protein
MTANVKQSKWATRNNASLANLPRLRNAAEHKLLEGDVIAATFNATVLTANALGGTLGDALAIIDCDDPARWSDHDAPLTRVMVGFTISETGAFCCPRHVGLIDRRDIRDGEVVPVFADDDHDHECKGCEPSAGE